MANSRAIQQAFNTQFGEFVEAITTVFPDDRDIKKSKALVETLQKANPKAVIKMWKTSVADPYHEQILSGDVEYFLNKDYSSDVKGDQTILQAIDKFRSPIKSLDDKNKETAMQYIQNLTRLSMAYE